METVAGDTLRELTDLADKLTYLRGAKERFENELRDTNKNIDDIEMKMAEIMGAADITKFGHGDRLFYSYVSSFPSINKEKEEAFFAWLEEHGEEGIIKRTVHPQTLRKWYKDQAEAYGEELTGAEMIAVFEKVKIGVRSAT